MESKCRFQQNGVLCPGKPKLINVKNYQTSISNYVIGCDKYQSNDKYHRYIKVDPTTYDIPLLRDLFSGNAIMVYKMLNELFKFFKKVILFFNNRRSKIH